MILDAVVALSLAVLGCAPISSRGIPNTIPAQLAVFDRELQRWIDGTGAAPPPLPGPAGSVPIRNCAELINALRFDDLGERAERQEFLPYSPCLAEAVVRQGRRPDFASFDLKRAGIEIYSCLDLSSVRSSLAPRRPARTYFLHDFSFKSKKLSALSLSLVDDHFRYSFTVLAIGDFSHSGRSELLVRFVDKGIVGTYHSESILILGRRKDGGIIAATDAIKLLRGVDLREEILFLPRGP